MVFLEWIMLFNPHVFASRPWDLSAHVEHGMWLLESSDAFHCRDVRTGRSMHHLAAASGERVLDAWRHVS